MIYQWVVLISVVLVGAAALFFLLVTRIYSLSCKQLDKQEVKVFVKMMLGRTRQLKWEFKELKNLKHVKLRYGGYFDIECGAAASYFMNLIDTWASLVILF